VIGAYLHGTNSFNMRHLSLILMLLLWAVGHQTFATHSLGGEFRYSHLQGLTYSIEFHYWTCLEAPADRPELILDYGDGVLDTVPRTSITDSPSAAGCCGGIRYSVYSTAHTYPSPGIYTLKMDDQNRNGGIVNIPNSISQSFCVTATLYISPITGNNNSAVFGSGPMDWEYVWSTLVFDPMVTDTDGDSLSFELVTPLGLNCEPIAGYSFPSSPAPGWTWLDPATGVFSWYLPQTIGQFGIAIRASEWRNGQLIGQVTRDMILCIFQLPTSLDEVEHTSMITFRPSLADDLLLITNPGSIPAALRLFDSLGRPVDTFLAQPGERILHIHGLAAGSYLLLSEQSIVGRFIKR